MVAAIEMMIMMNTQNAIGSTIANNNSCDSASGNSSDRESIFAPSVVFVASFKSDQYKQ